MRKVCILSVLIVVYIDLYVAFNKTQQLTSDFDREAQKMLQKGGGRNA